MTFTDYLTKHPNARPSTLVYLEKRDAKTAQLRSEIEAAKRASTTAPVRQPPKGLRELAIQTEWA